MPYGPWGTKTPTISPSRRHDCDAFQQRGSPNAASADIARTGYRASVRYVAFLRNVNQGQHGHPSTAMIVEAFVSAGCDDAVPFQSNGTVVFEASDADGVVADVVGMLGARGFPRDCFVMPESDLAFIARAWASSPMLSHLELTLHGAGTLDVDDQLATRETERRRCRLMASGPGWVVVLNERERESNGTPAVERTIDGPATSRSLRTVIRLLDRHVSP